MKRGLIKSCFVLFVLLLPQVFAGTITGTAFEDYNYGGGLGRAYVAASGMAVVSGGATVELYNASTGAFIRSETTNASGSYTFGDVSPATDLVLTAGSYYVRIVNSTVRSTRTGGSACATCIPVQTFRMSAAGTADTARVGGEKPEGVDAGVGAIGASITAAGVLSGTVTGQAQSISPIAVTASGAGATVTGINFGFNFSTIVNKNDTGQGSLRQFIINSNALSNTTPALAQSGSTTNTRGVTSALPSGKEASIFMIPDGNARSGLRLGLTNQLTAGVAVIQVGTLLTAILDGDTIIDGGTQTFNIANTNTTTLNTATTVGIDNLSVPAIQGPEVQLQPSSTFYATATSGLTVGATATNSTVQNLSVLGFSADTAGGTDQANIYITAGATGAMIRWNVVGATATLYSDPGATARTTDYGIIAREGSLTVRENIVAFSGAGGVALS
jgi:hypothetical protein